MAEIQQIMKRISKSYSVGQGDIFSSPKCYGMTKNRRVILFYFFEVPRFLGREAALSKTPPFNFKSIFGTDFRAIVSIQCLMDLILHTLKIPGNAEISAPQTNF